MHAILIYGFPLILVAFEWGLRSVLKVDAGGFIGPTLAAASLTTLVQLTKPKKVAIRASSNKHIVVSAYDQQLIAFVWLVVLLTMFAWLASCYFSVQASTLTTLQLPTHVAIGLTTYLVSIILVMVKEVI